MTELRITDAAQTSQIYRVRGQKSLLRYPNPKLSPENCEILRDVNISNRETAESRFGNIKYNSTVLASSERATGLWQGKFASGDVRQVVVTPTKVYSDDGTTRTDITGSALTGGNDDRLQFVFVKDQLVSNNRVDTVRVWTGSLGSNTSDLTTVPWTKVNGIFTHNNLLMVWGPTEGGTFFPTRLRYCDINRRTFQVDINVWPDANRYEVYDGGPAIVGVVDAWGKALIFKEDGMYIGQIAYSDLGLLDFRLDPAGVRRGFTPISHSSLLSRPEFVYGAAREGIFIIRPDFSFELINSDDATEWFALNQGRLQYAQATVREKEHQVRLAVSSESNTDGHDYVLVWDWDTGDLWIERPTQLLNVIESIVIADEELDWTGTTDGFLRQGNKSTYLDDDGTGFPWWIKMQPNDLGFPGQSKHILNIKTLHRKRLNSQTLAINIAIDEGRNGTVNGLLDVTTNLKWNTTLKWDAGVKWPGSGAQVVNFFVNRMCETFTPEWSSEDPAGIEGYQVEFLLLEN